MNFNEEFVIGKNGIGWMSSTFTTAFKDAQFVSVFTPTYQKLPRSMNDAAIESELKPGICTLGDVVAFLDNARDECKDGLANLFYFPSFVVRVRWDGSDWSVDAWARDGDDWLSGCRVFSPATVKPSSAVSSGSSPLTLESLADRVERLEKIINPELLK